MIAGWAPSETVHVTGRDEAGLPTTFHVEREPAWDDEQAALLLAVQAKLAEEEAANEVGPHGIPMADATSPLADPNNRLEGWHYETRVRIDHAQRALNIAQEERRKAYPDEDHGSLLWSLVRVEDGPRKPPPHVSR